MKKTYLNPRGMTASPYYSHTVTAEGAGKLVYVSGQVSWDANGNVVGKGDMRAQAEQVFKNVEAALKAAGAGWGDVIKMNGYMVGMHGERVDAYREVRQRFLKKGALPASTLVGVERLVDPELLLEVEVVATVKKKR
jgi:enamine deaminase RidA (YjgF/YER057c/UK114 family)